MTVFPPRWLVALGSVAIAGHLAAVVAGVLASPSGPWPAGDGWTMATPPQFAHAVAGQVAPYTRLVKLSHNFHFDTNRTGVPGVSFEIKLKDETGAPVATVRLPEPGVNASVRQRQAILARQLADDQPVAPPQGEAVPAPGQPVRGVAILDFTGPRSLRLRTVPEHLVPRDRPVFTPSEWSLVLARSYTRFACRKYGAASGEFVRHTREAVPPAALFADDAPAGNFEDLVTTFGEFPR